MYFPAAQFEHSFVPAAENIPLEHNSHEEISDCTLEYFPAGQLGQLEALAEVDAEPAGQTEHAVDPAAPANFPTTHPTQLVAPALDEKPALQLAQLEAPPAE